MQIPSCKNSLKFFQPDPLRGSTSPSLDIKRSLRLLPDGSLSRESFIVWVKCTDHWYLLDIFWNQTPIAIKAWLLSTGLTGQCSRLVVYLESLNVEQFFISFFLVSGVLLLHIGQSQVNTSPENRVKARWCHFSTSHRHSVLIAIPWISYCD